jgi:hypothetical protein
MDLRARRHGCPNDEKKFFVFRARVSKIRAGSGGIEGVFGGMSDSTSFRAEETIE